jgi:hypothetical protein
MIYSGRMIRNHYNLIDFILILEVLKEFQKISYLWQNWMEIGSSHPPQSLFQSSDSSSASALAPEERIILLNKTLIKLYNNPES